MLILSTLRTEGSTPSVSIIPAAPRLPPLLRCSVTGKLAPWDGWKWPQNCLSVAQPRAGGACSVRAGVYCTINTWHNAGDHGALLTIACTELSISPWPKPNPKLRLIRDQQYVAKLWQSSVETPGHVARTAAWVTCEWRTANLWTFSLCFWDPFHR